jgi:hypothetical protein
MSAVATGKVDIDIGARAVDRAIRRVRDARVKE